MKMTVRNTEIQFEQKNKSFEQRDDDVVADVVVVVFVDVALLLILMLSL